jgi:ABC-type glycerol-3-phosphate transport system substrate-binding protein
MIAEYRKRYPDVELVIEMTPAGTDYRQSYDRALMAGNAPDVTNMFPPVDIQTRGKNGTIRDITQWVNNWDLKKQGLINSAFDEALVIDGKWYAIIDKLYVAATPYNRIALTAGGGNANNLPKTWTDFAAVGTRITDASVPRFGYLLVGMEWNAWPFTPWVWAAGGEMVRKNADGTYKIAFTEEPGVDAAEMWNAMVWRYGMTQKDVLKNWDDLIDDMATNRGVFAWGTLDTYAFLAYEKYGVPRDSYGIMPVPAKDGNTRQASLCGGEVWTFNPRATDAQVEAGWNFAQLNSFDPAFLESYWAFQNTLNGISFTIPGRTDLTEVKFGKYGVDWPTHWVAEIDAVSRITKLEPYCPNWNDLKNILAPYLQQIILKEGITRDEIRSVLNRAADEAYSSYPQSFKK